MPRQGSARATRRAARAGGSLHQLPWRNVTNPYAPVEVLEPEGVDAIHEASLDILATTGMDFLHPEAIGILAAHGARIDGARVRFDPDLVMEWVRRAPSSFTLHARNPARDVDIGGSNVVFLSVASAPNASDLDRGRRPGTFADFQDFVRLGQSFNIVHSFGGYPVEPQDIAPGVRHLHALASFATLSDKTWHAYSLGRGRILDAIEIARIARGVDLETLRREASIHTIINTSSPLRLDGPMIEGMIEMLRHGQAVVITPFTLAGAMAPATVAGALALQNAEALAGIAFGQMVSPGAPMMYGGFTSNVDMKSGSPAFGTPEYARAAMAGGQLARRYGIPFRSSNANASNAVDAQAAYESQTSLWAAVLGGGNFIMHAAGWMEGGLVASFEKFVVDIELLQMMAEFLMPLRVDADTLGLAAIAEVGPGGHFFGSPHTLERYEDAFYAPILSDWQNFGSWTESGSLTAEMRANHVWKRVLAEYEAPPLAEGIRDELADFVARRVAEGGVG
ncbi:MAG TPA: trimethylamine methyltransferase family protein [Acidimicrobiia bacterium]|nr:trimethylamine methyltransferase family protein [Acidimicrobiia bacterium]